MEDYEEGSVLSLGVLERSPRSAATDASASPPVPSAVLAEPSSKAIPPTYDAWIRNFSSEILSFRITASRLLVSQKRPADEACTDCLHMQLLAGGLFDAAGHSAEVEEIRSFLVNLSDTDVGVGEAELLVKVMRKNRMKTNEQGDHQRDNHVVHAMCAALIWHLDLGAEALSLARGQSTVPSKAISDLWRSSNILLKQFMRDGSKNTSQDELYTKAPSPRTSTDAQLGPIDAGVGGTPSTTSAIESSTTDSSMPARPALKRQFSLPFPGAHKELLDSAAMVIVRRARLLLKVEPMTRCVSATNQQSKRSAVSMGGGGEGETAATETIVFLDEDFTKKHITNSAFDFVKLGPDPDTLLECMEKLSVATRLRLEGLLLAKGLLLRGADDDTTSVAAVAATATDAAATDANANANQSKLEKRIMEDRRVLCYLSHALRYAWSWVGFM